MPVPLHGTDGSEVFESLGTSIQAESEREAQKSSMPSEQDMESLVAAADERANAAEAEAAAMREDNSVLEAQVEKLTADLKQSADIASAAIAEAGRLRQALQDQHGAEMKQLRAELDTSIAESQGAAERALSLRAELEALSRAKAEELQAANLAAAAAREEHESQIELLIAERDQARDDAQRHAEEAAAWADGESE